MMSPRDKQRPVHGDRGARNVVGAVEVDGRESEPTARTVAAFGYLDVEPRLRALQGDRRPERVPCGTVRRVARLVAIVSRAHEQDTEELPRWDSHYQK